MRAVRNGIVSHGKTLFKILRQNMETALDCDRIWDDYFASVTTNSSQPSSTPRFQRLNPRLDGEVPGLDEKDKMGQVRKLAKAAFLKDPAVHGVAQQLLASLFYFQLSNISDGGGRPDVHHVQGETGIVPDCLWPAVLR